MITIEAAIIGAAISLTSWLLGYLAGRTRHSQRSIDAAELTYRAELAEADQRADMYRFAWLSARRRATLAAYGYATGKWLDRDELVVQPEDVTTVFNHHTNQITAYIIRPRRGTLSTWPHEETHAADAPGCEPATSAKPTTPGPATSAANPSPAPHSPPTTTSPTKSTTCAPSPKPPTSPIP